MGRYVRILATLAVLAGIYSAVGGFDGPERLMQVEPPLAASAVESPVTASISPANMPLPGTETSLGRSEQAWAEAQDLSSHEHGMELDGGGWTRVAIGRNESFYVAATRAGLKHEDVMALVKACRPHTDLRRVQRGDTFDLRLDHESEAEALRFELDKEHYLVANRGDAGFDTQIGAYELERVVKGVRGTIESNLFDALKNAGADPSLAVQLSEILAWDIDFFRDLRKGDTFTLLYEEYTRSGERVRDGRILSAQFVNQGRTAEAFLYENAIGFPAYYDAEGRSLEKQFLRAPLRYSRVSSGFSRRRLHPVTKRYQPHYGVDYAAPTGTPVHATADGVVATREKRRGNGNYVVLRHGGTYETWYLHLSRYAKGLGVGHKVRQGDVIGYVGQTGLATAPHLDYRVKKNGKFLDPRKLDLPPAEPVEAERRDAFEARREELLAQRQLIPQKASTVVLTSQRSGGVGSEEPAGR